MGIPVLLTTDIVSELFRTWECPFEIPSATRFLGGSFAISGFFAELFAAWQPPELRSTSVRALGGLSNAAEAFEGCPIVEGSVEGSSEGASPIRLSI
jgi:hypothetical protein